MQALERLIDRLLAHGEHGAARVHAARLVGLDPLSEIAHRYLIEAHLGAGDRSAAERQYACAWLLADELGVAPDPQTTTLLEAPLIADAASGSGTRYAERNGMHLAEFEGGDHWPWVGDQRSIIAAIRARGRPAGRGAPAVDEACRPARERAPGRSWSRHPRHDKGD